MNLLYLWIEEYKNIKQQHINIFDINVNFDKLKKEISINTDKEKLEKKLKFKNNFFSTTKEKKIKNITAIVGKNGSGKSNVIEFLIKIFDSSFKGRTSIEENKDEVFIGLLNYFLIVWENEEFIIYTDIEGLKTKDGIKIINVFSIENGIERNNGTGRIAKKIIDIFFTASYNKARVSIDISNGNFISNTSETGRKFNKYTSISSNEDSLGRMRITDYKYIAIFICDNKKFLNILSDKLEINIPTEIIFTSKSYLPNYKNGEKINESTRFDEIIANILTKLSLNPLEQYILFYFCNRFMEIIFNIYRKNIDEILEKISKQIKNSTLQTLDDIFSIIINNDFFVSEFESNHEKFTRMKEILMVDQLVELKEQLLYVEDLFKKNMILMNEKGYNFSYKINLLEKNKLNDFLENVPIAVSEEFFDITYGQKLSRGEEAFLILLSRLFVKLDEYRVEKNKDELKEYVFYIDEGEDGFHPEWQRRYIQTLIEIMEYLLKDDEKVQLFITSHSPFIASDLPRENVIMLNSEIIEKKDELGKILRENNCKVITENKNNTFGANIHELYKDSFFLDSTMGEFALNKIKKVIDDLSTLELIKKEYIKKIEEKNLLSSRKTNFFLVHRKVIKKMREIESRKNEMKYIIDIIGEKVLSRKLKEKYREIFEIEESEEEKLNDVRKLLLSKGFHEDKIKDILISLGDDRC